MGKAGFLRLMRWLCVLKRWLVQQTGGRAFSDALGSAVDRRAYFLLLRQNKVAKEKATPAYAVGFADCLALLEAPGGCGTRLGCAKPQTVLADFPRPFSAAQRFRWGP